MYGCFRNGARFLAIAMIGTLASACSVTSSPEPASRAPVAAPPVAGPSFPSFVPAPRSVDASLAQPCIIAAANKYFLPERVISAVNSRPGAGGGTDVDLKVDKRTAVCQLNANGSVRAVIDTTPKSADQIAAEEAAARESAAAGKKPQPRAKKK
ncbi:hypothetical protein ACFO1V_13620 [Daeguia caeni]|uniref:Uncharacterized protein n=1 Tax=Daeguia caeni TaxID=439612 RepID=A0ABV9HAP8_9HYPH